MDDNNLMLDSKISFQIFCELLEKIKKCKNQEKYYTLCQYFNECRKIAEENNLAPNLYPILRLLLPQADRERGSYGIKETALSRLYIRVLCIPKHTNDAIKLSNYKSPSASSSVVADFAEVAYWILKSRCQSMSGNFTLKEINFYLDNIASYHADNLSREIDNELTKIVNNMSAMQQKWLIRIILKDLKLGISQTKILSSFHTDAPDLYDSENNLQKICTILYSRKIHLNEIEVKIFSSFRPMLSERLDISKINFLMKNQGEFFLEKKFDGERFQVHMENGTYKYFSRNGYDYTEVYGSNYNNGLLTKQLKDIMNPSVDNFIIDGEMMGWQKEKKIFSSKGINFDVKKLNEYSSYQPCLCAFDILLYNGEILTNTILYERVKYLDKLFTDKPGVILHSVRQQINKSNQVLDALNKAIENQDEGIIIKTTMSKYKPNNRKGGWYKIKPEYTEGVMNELDLLIIGGYFSENKQHGLIGSVLLGVASFADIIDNKPTIFYSCGRVKLTIHRSEIEELCCKLQPYWNEVKKDINPSSICWTKDKPDVWIEPEKSYIVQVKATELVYSTQFKTNYTLRFPRIEKIRYDKSWYDCLTTEEFSNLTQYSHGVEKLTARTITDDDIKNSNEVLPCKRAKSFNIASQFLPVVVTDLQEKSSLFSGKEFCILVGNDEFSKSDLEIKVLENGGHVVQNPGINTFCIIAGTMNVRVKNVIESGKYNVAKISWLLKSLKPDRLKNNKLLEWSPHDLIGISDKTREEFVYKYDEYGDSYTVPTTLDSLKLSMERVEDEIPIYLLHRELVEMDQLFFNGSSPYSFMRSYTFYFLDGDESYISPLHKLQTDLLKFEIKMYAGKCSEKLDSNITHIIIEDFDKELIENIVVRMESIGNFPKIVSVEWLNKCLKLEKIIKIDNYEINIDKILS